MIQSVETLQTALGTAQDVAEKTAPQKQPLPVANEAANVQAFELSNATLKGVADEAAQAARELLRGDN